MPTDMSKLYEIILSDGSRLANLHLNGNNFVSKTEVTEDMFKGKLSKIRITDHQGYDSEFKYAELTHIEQYENSIFPGWHFAFYFTPESEIRWREMESNIRYLAMMSELEL